MYTLIIIIYYYLKPEPRYPNLSVESNICIGFRVANYPQQEQMFS